MAEEDEESPEMGDFLKKRFPEGVADQLFPKAFY